MAPARGACPVYVSQVLQHQQVQCTSRTRVEGIYDRRGHAYRVLGHLGAPP
jgi:hypothetical protein